MSAIAVPCYDGGHGSAFFLEAELTGVLGCFISTSFESADPRYDGWRGFAFLQRPSRLGVLGRFLSCPRLAVPCYNGRHGSA